MASPRRGQSIKWRAARSATSLPSFSDNLCTAGVLQSRKEDKGRLHRAHALVGDSSRRPLPEGEEAGSERRAGIFAGRSSACPAVRAVVQAHRREGHQPNRRRGDGGGEGLGGRQKNRRVDMKHEGSLIREIRRAVRDGRLNEPFGAGDVIRAGICRARSTPGTFLPKHRVGNPGGNSELFVRVASAKYRLKERCA